MIVSTTLTESYRSAVALEQYAKAVEYTECAFFGVYVQPDVQVVGDQCRDIWTQQQRNYIQRYLAEAQIELENETKTLFGRTWITGDLSAQNERLSDVVNYSNLVDNGNRWVSRAKHTKWRNIKALGKRVDIELGTSIVLDQSSDPATATVTIDPSVVTDITRIKIFEAGNYGTDRAVELNPSDISISGTDLNITIPRCRSVLFANRDNPVAGLQYTDLSNFISEIDIYYATTSNDESYLLTKTNCTCATRESTGCLQFATVNTPTVIPTGQCYPLSCLCSDSDTYMGFYYEAGEITLNQMQIDMIIRLTHSKMPNEPCGCERAQRLWMRDRNIPEILTRERLECPFGINDGAWIAWKWAQTLKKRRFGYM